MRVLVVGGAPEPREALCGLVGLAGNVPLVSASAPEALALLEAGVLPDAILVDASEAEQLVSRLRSDPRWGWIPLIAVVSDPSSDAPSLRATTSLVRPFGVGRLLAVLEAAVQRAATM